jgi:hypothetical protein
MPTVLRRGRAVARVGRVLSQLDTGYPEGALAVDAGPPWPRGPRAGERVPDAMVICGGRRLSLHRLLGRPDSGVSRARAATTGSGQTVVVDTTVTVLPEDSRGYGPVPVPGCQA